jgi:sporulation protein YlmC with PRC-barrel domain
MISEEKLIQENMTGRNHEGARPNFPVRFLTASSVIGDEVENKSGEKLGHIKDIMLDIHHGGIEYVVLEFKEGILSKKKMFAIPFHALRLNPKKRMFIVDWSKEILEKAPGFDKHHWPETNKHYEDVNHYWGFYMGANAGHDT